MQWLNRLGAKKGTIGIEYQSQGLGIAVHGVKSTGLDKIHLIRFDDETPADQLDVLLQNFVAKNKVERRLCNLVLNPEDYQLLLVEAPDVPEDEMREAVRWKIKELISIPVEQAALDVFLLPADANKSGKRMLYVVVAALEKLKTLSVAINESGLILQSIDIAELSLRNLCLLKAQDRGVALARLRDGEGSLSIYRAGNLYLSRQFKLNYKGGLLEDLPSEALALELQRSLDYFERQMGQQPPAVLYLGGEGVSPDKITQDLSRSVTVPLSFLDLSAELPGSADMDEGMMQLCLGALGAVHRKGGV